MPAKGKRTIAVFLSVPALTFGGVGVADAARPGGPGSPPHAGNRPARGAPPAPPAARPGDAARTSRT